MLTLPAEVSSNKDLLENSPVLLIDIAGKSFYISSKPITLTGYTYLQLLLRDVSLQMGVKIPDLVNELSSLSSPSLKLISWRDDLRTALVGATPDLTGESVDLFLKYDIGGTQSKANAVKFYQGIIANWGVEGDVMNIGLNNILNFKVKIPQGTMKDVNPQTQSPSTAKPIQIGNFNWSMHPFFFYDRDMYARLILDYYDQGTNTAYWYIAKHEMSNLPTDTQLEAGQEDCYLFVLRDNTFSHIDFDTDAVGAIANSAAGANFSALLTDSACYLSRPMTAEGADNNAPTTSYVMDGKESTYTTIENGSFDTLDVRNPDFLGFTENQPYPSYLNRTNIWFWVRFGTVNGSGTISVTAYNPSGTEFQEASFDSGDSDSWVFVSLPATDFRNLSETFDDLYNNCRAKVVINSGTNAQILEVQVQVRVTDLNSSELNNVYLRCQGKEYTDTWNSRKTVGVLMENPADVVEMLLRDEMGQATADIDTDSFDVVNTAFGSIDARGTISHQGDYKSILGEICGMFNFSLIRGLTGLWRLVLPTAADNVFPASGTSTPGDEDIFIDLPVIANNTYDRHPIDARSFSLSRSNINEVYSKLVLNFGSGSDQYLFSVESGSGDNVKTINNWLVGDKTSAQNLIDKIDQWFLNQKMIAQFDTYFNGIAVEVGDLINVRHSALVDNLLSATVNTQKWIVLELNTRWRPNKIQITAIELL